MRKFEKITQLRWYVNRALNRGLKEVHIGDGVWLFGRQKHIKGKGMHMVVYGPDRRTEYHIWGQDVNDLVIDDDYGNNGYVNRDGNRASEEKVKIYILTTILDKRENWCFDLKAIPENGPLKVIYSNGTVKNIEFNGVFENVELKKDWGYRYEVSPVAYRIK